MAFLPNGNDNFAILMNVKIARQVTAAEESKEQSSSVMNLRCLKIYHNLCEINESKLEINFAIFKRTFFILFTSVFVFCPLTLQNV